MKKRLSVSVDEDLIKSGEKAVSSGRAASLSAWVNEALQREVDHERGMEAFDEAMASWEAKFGKITEEDMKAADHWARERAIRVRPKVRRSPRKPESRDVA